MQDKEQFRELAVESIIYGRQQLKSNSTLHCIAICRCLWLSEEHVTVTELFLFCDVRSLFLLFFTVLFVCLSPLFSCVSFSLLATVFLMLRVKLRRIKTCLDV